jgi:hypothetical protein
MTVLMRSISDLGSPSCLACAGQHQIEIWEADLPIQCQAVLGFVRVGGQRQHLSTMLSQFPKTNRVRAIQEEIAMEMTSIDGHHDAVTDDHKHSPLSFGDETWTFDHLRAFVMKLPIELTPKNMVEIDVVVLFTNHCFSRELKPDEVVDESFVVMDGSTRRVMDKQRYELSRRYLPQLVQELISRHIRIADPTRPNFVTVELQPALTGQKPLYYAMFFEVKKDRTRKRRLLLRVQSAYILENPSKRLLNADKMRFHVILKRALA